jgi:hypothetical protein
MLAQRAEEVLEIAAEAGREIGEDTAILINRHGGMRMLNAAGWSLSGLLAEFGAAAVYKVERRSAAIRVEAGSGSERCFIERALAEARPSHRPIPLPAPPSSAGWRSGGVPEVLALG